MPITITIPAGSEAYDSERNEFYSVDSDLHITLEHSLVSLKKWEQRWHDPFLDKNTVKTNAMSLDYIRCMTLTKNVPDYAYKLIPASEFIRIKKYIADPMTATKIKDRGKRKRKEIKTAEVIYSDMIKLGIPFECEKWHLNTLIMLIAVCAHEQNPEEDKMSRAEVLAENRALNAARKAALHSKG